MRLVVNEYEIPLDTIVATGSATIDMPSDWEALEIGVDADGKLTLYALVDPDSDPCPVCFQAYPTGVELDVSGMVPAEPGGDEVEVRHLGSVQLESVWHLFWMWG